MPETIRGIHYQTGDLIEIQIREGKISEIHSHGEPDHQNYPLICPGFIDVQVNGSNSFDLNDPQLVPETVVNLIHSLARQGVTSCMPTVITASSEQIHHIMRTVHEACEMDALVQHSIVGIHLEGPYLSPEPGFCGAHPVDCMKDPDIEQFLAWNASSGGRIKMVTLAPEREGAIPFIKELHKLGIVPAIGHSCAKTEDIQLAIEAGLRMCTHLGNGIHYRIDRHAPFVWDLLACQDLYAGFIADGHHLTRSVVQVFVHVKKEKSILVSDAVHLTGMPPGRYRTHIGGEVELNTNGRLHLVNDPNILAGSASSLWDGIRTMLQWFPDKLQDVLDMAGKHPAQLLGLSHKGYLKEGFDADIVLLRRDHKDGSYQLDKVYQRGSLHLPHHSLDCCDSN